jgi:dihydroorotate dehydrogenase electron transfer subunit
LDIHGPLGKPFEVYPPDRQVIFIAGGMGIAPLTFLAGHYRSTKAGAKMKMVCYLGAKNSDSIIGLERMQTLCETKVSTDDASMGRLGFVTDLFRLDMTRYTPGKAVIYACGPRPMMKALAGLLADQDFPCQVSLEERMACGIGVCLGCVTAVKDHWGRKQYQRICMEGPVFGIQNVIWN